MEDKKRPPSGNNNLPLDKRPAEPVGDIIPPITATGKQNITVQYKQTTTSIQTNSPIPSAQEMAGYKSISEDFPERIMAQFEKEADHRRSCEMQCLSASIQHDVFGRRTAFLFVFLTLIFSAFMIYTDHNITGSIFGGTIIVTVVSAFMTERLYNKKSHDTSDKTEE